MQGARIGWVDHSTGGAPIMGSIAAQVADQQKAGIPLKYCPGYIKNVLHSA